MKPSWISIAVFGSLVAGCLDPSDELGDAGLDDEPTPIALLGEACQPQACRVDQCGMVADGCRAEMWCGDCACPAGQMSCDRANTRVFELQLSGSGSFTIATSALSAGADPVLHVLNASGSEIAFDDNSAGGGNAVVRLFVLPFSQPPRVVVRAKSSATAGSGTLLINGSPRPIAFGGAIQTYSNLRANEQIESIKLFGSVSDVHVIYALAPDGLHVQGRALGNATASGAVWTQTAAIASRSFVFGTINAASSPSQWIRNDAAIAGHDGDGDGLGSELEAAIGTCRSGTDIAVGRDGTQFDCARTTDPRDTDADGLSDGIELRGIRSSSPHLPLRLWGADPRHKDMFVEVDTSQTTPGAPTPMLSPGDARRFSDYYGDRTRALTPLMAAVHAAVLKNPDARPGIRTHLDIGVAPTSTADAKLYGNWGGWSVVPPLNGGGQDPNQAFRTYLAPNRLAVFRYALWYQGGGGQTPTSLTCVGCGSYAWSSGNAIDTFTHESIHAHGLGHSGPADLTAPVDPNCKASYPSIINYAFQGAGYGLSDGTGMTAVNNAAVREWQAVSPPSPTVLGILRDTFGYAVDLAAGHVDWNRDGVFAAAGTTVKAYTNYQPGNACEFTRYNSQLLPTSSNTGVSPAFGRFGSTTYVFSGGTSQLRFVSSSSAFACPQPSLAACGTWSATQTLNVDATRGVDAARVFDADGRSALLVVTAAADGKLYFLRRETTAIGIPRWTAAQWLPVLALSSGEPSLTTLPDGRALLVFRRPDDGMVIQAVYRYDAAGGTSDWDRWGPAMDDTGATIYQSAQATPGLAPANFAGRGAATYGLFATVADAVLQLRKFDPANWRWTAAELALDDANVWWRSVTGRPVGVWVPSSDSAQGGRMYVLTTTKDGIGDGTGRGLVMRWSYVKNGELRLGLTSGYDSWWTYTRGVDAWFDPGVDTNLRVAWSISPLTNPGQDSQIRFDPKGDGINDFVQANYDDWPVVGYSLCRSLVNPTGSIANPIQCGPRPW